PFGGEDRNPTLEILGLLPRRRAGFAVATLALPVVFGESVARAVEALRETRPDAVLMLGQAGGRADVAIERVAVNLDDARIPDNRRRRPVDRPIDPEGPAAYFSTFPSRAILAAMTAAGVPASLSYSAGTFVCNHLSYGVLGFLAKEGRGVPAGFIHLPWLPEQVVGKPGAPSMSLELSRRAVLAAIDATGESLGLKLAVRRGD
ncbi:MAG: pyroglutamyl-peptidase I, partial [Spirochaetaceae bacterium]|nr:pyroglutamyl-peptidase I [Spirochaetaceae bacterium]